MVTALDKQTALILIDLQNGIVKKRQLAHPVEEVLQQSVKLIDSFRKAGLPVVIVNVNPKNAAWTNSRKDDKPQQSMSSLPPDMFEIVSEIKKEPEDILITKHTWNAFYETALHEELKKRHITGIVLGGVSTSIGVEGTARNASELGFNITFAKDAMTDAFAEAHENSLKFIFPRLGEVDNTNKIIEKIEALMR